MIKLAVLDDVVDLTYRIRAFLLYPWTGFCTPVPHQSQIYQFIVKRFRLSSMYQKPAVIFVYSTLTSVVTSPLLSQQVKCTMETTPLVFSDMSRTFLHSLEKNRFPHNSYTKFEHNETQKKKTYSWQKRKGPKSNETKTPFKNRTFRKLEDYC